MENTWNLSVSEQHNGAYRHFVRRFNVKDQILDNIDLIMGINNFQPCSTQENVQTLH